MFRFAWLMTKDSCANCVLRVTMVGLFKEILYGGLNRTGKPDSERCDPLEYFQSASNRCCHLVASRQGNQRIS